MAEDFNEDEYKTEQQDKISIRDSKGRFVEGYISLRKGKYHTKEAKKKISLIQIGKKLTNKHRINISKGVKNHLPKTSFKKGVMPYNKILNRIYNCPLCNKKFEFKRRSQQFCSNECAIEDRKGKHLSLKTELKKNDLRTLHLVNKSLEKRRELYPYQFKRGKGVYPSKFRFLRKLIFKRDNNICKLCNKEAEIIHHIDYNKENCDINNLIALCNSCHCKTNYRREEWTQNMNKMNR